MSRLQLSAHWPCYRVRNVVWDGVGVDAVENIESYHEKILSKILDYSNLQNYQYNIKQGNQR